MINLANREDCVGCNACGDICNHGAISFKTDIEGFCYPEVDINKCTKCGLCEKICPVIHVDELKGSQFERPIVYAAYNKDLKTRKISTSGGIFSCLAETMYKQSGYVGGAIYTEDFSVQHLISNKEKDLELIRGSKHAQSDMSGIFRKIKNLLSKGEKVLICAAPCQIAGLKLYLNKEYENLITIDFLCLGINSPKVFHKYINSLERKFGAKVINIQVKNKDLGWRSLAYKIKFSNQKIYLKPGREDAFTRGFIDLHCNCRPACYECKFKGFPRISDISLGDFWGIENIDKTMDDNIGTSVILVNSLKGNLFFDLIKENLIWKKKKIEDVLIGNGALIRSLSYPTINREEFYSDIDKLPYEDVVKKYFPIKNKYQKIKTSWNIFRRSIGFRPLTILRFTWLNFIRKNTIRTRKKAILIPSPYSVLDIDPSAQILLKSTFFFGYQRVRGSKLESSLLLEAGAKLTLGNNTSSRIYYGVDIQVFKNAELSIGSQVTLNRNVQIICMEKITIGNDVLISRDVIIRDNDGGHKMITDGYKTSTPISIGNHVWIGHGAMIMKGVTIGDGAIIGAGAWVVSNVKPFCSYGRSSAYNTEKCTMEKIGKTA